MNRVIALTGGIAAGKSTVAQILTSLGAKVVDADVIARDVVAPGTPGLASVVEAFGSDIVSADGALDRAALGTLVFADVQARQRLEGILHPLIAIASAEAIQAAMAETDGPVFYEAALLVENGSYRNFETLVVVTAPDDVQLDRIVARDGLDRHAAERRLAAQLPTHEKVALADYVLHNDDSFEHLRAQVVALFEAVR